MSDLYFGYGSNLHGEDFAEFCRGHGYDAQGLCVLDRAWLADHAIAFTVSSVTRQGGVLDIVPRAGAFVPGVLFTIDHAREGWRTLDHKESAGEKYVRREALVHDEAGRAHAVHTYEVLGHLRQPFVAPAERYLQIVCDGLVFHGHTDAHVRAAAKGAYVEIDVPEAVRTAHRLHRHTYP